MRRPALALAVLLAPLGAPAQAPQAVLESCRAHAEAEARKTGAASATVTLARDADLHFERQARRVGSQALAALVFGNGTLLVPGTVPVEMSFVCLVGTDGRALFFHWTPRRDAPVLAQCRRAAKPAECLDALLSAAEHDLVELYAKHFLDNRQADSTAGNDHASRAFRASADAFLAYRAAECARRGASGSDAHKACLVELTRRRALDLR